MRACWRGQRVGCKGCSGTPVAIGMLVAPILAVLAMGLGLLLSMSLLMGLVLMMSLLMVPVLMMSLLMSLSLASQAEAAIGGALQGRSVKQGAAPDDAPNVAPCAAA